MTLDLKIAMVQMEITNEPKENAERFLEYARAAATEGTDIVVGSEMMLAPYFRGDSYEDVEFVQDVWSSVQAIISASRTIDAVLIFGGIGLDEDETEKNEDGRLRKYNAAFVVHNGELITNHADLPFAIKTLLPDYRIFDDNRYFHSLRKVAEENSLTTESLLKPFPVTIRGRVYQLGVMLCEDMWDMDYSLKPAQVLHAHGAEVLINLSCSNWSWQKNEKRDRVIKDICRQTNLPFVYVNNVGCQNNGKNFITFDGASTAYNAQGEIIALCDSYQEQIAVVDMGLPTPPLTRKPIDDTEQMFFAIVEGTRGFLKTLPVGMKKVVIGVSGGIDSALSVAFFAHVLGPENVIAINMPYKNFNSAETRNDAKTLCERLGVKYYTRAIDKIAQQASILAQILPNTNQQKNVQAIARMIPLSTAAAQENAFFTCNANWTEAFFGYGTLNGDLRGHFAPWGNCLKQDIYRLAVYMNDVVFGREVIPRSIIDRVPMDELVAQGAGSRGDPFDYGTALENGYHDQMVRAVIEFRHGPEWFIEQYQNGTLETALKLSPGRLNTYFEFDGKKFLDDLERCFALHEAAVFKRVQSVPNVLVGKRSFGWDYRESIGVRYKTRRYKELVEKFTNDGFPAYQAA